MISFINVCFYGEYACTCLDSICFIFITIFIYTHKNLKSNKQLCLFEITLERKVIILMIFYRTPAEAESCDNFSEENQVFSHGASGESFDDVKQFKVSYDKTNQGRENMENGTAHIAQLNGVPGDSCLIDEVAPSRRTEADKPPSVPNKPFRNISLSGEIMEGKTISKITSTSPINGTNKQASAANKFQKKFNQGRSKSVDVSFDFHENGTWTHPSKVPLSPSQLNNLSNSKGGFERSVSSEIGVSRSHASGFSSPTYCDDEVDSNSVAAASAAAVKQAIEEAQAKIRQIRLAKEMMEKRKEGRQNDVKLRSIRGQKAEERKEGNNNISKSYKIREETCGKVDIPMFQELGSIKSPETIQVTLDSKEEIKLSSARAALNETHGNEDNLVSVDCRREKIKESETDYVVESGPRMMKSMNECKREDKCFAQKLLPEDDGKKLNTVEAANSQQDQMKSVFVNEAGESNECANESKSIEEINDLGKYGRTPTVAEPREFTDMRTKSTFAWLQGDMGLRFNGTFAQLQEERVTTSISKIEVPPGETDITSKSSPARLQEEIDVRSDPMVARLQEDLRPRLQKENDTTSEPNTVWRQEETDSRLQSAGSQRQEETDTISESMVSRLQEENDSRSESLVPGKLEETYTTIESTVPALQGKTDSISETVSSVQEETNTRLESVVSFPQEENDAIPQSTIQQLQEESGTISESVVSQVQEETGTRSESVVPEQQEETGTRSELVVPEQQDKTGTRSESVVSEQEESGITSKLAAVHMVEGADTISEYFAQKESESISESTAELLQEESTSKSESVVIQLQEVHSTSKSTVAQLQEETDPKIETIQLQEKIDITTLESAVAAPEDIDKSVASHRSETREKKQRKQWDLPANEPRFIQKVKIREEFGIESMLAALHDEIEKPNVSVRVETSEKKQRRQWDRSTAQKTKLELRELRESECMKMMPPTDGQICSEDENNQEVHELEESANIFEEVPESNEDLEEQEIFYDTENYDILSGEEADNAYDGSQDQVEFGVRINAVCCEERGSKILEEDGEVVVNKKFMNAEENGKGHMDTCQGENLGCVTEKLQTTFDQIAYQDKMEMLYENLEVFGHEETKQRVEVFHHDQRRIMGETQACRDMEAETDSDVHEMAGGIQQKEATDQLPEVVLESETVEHYSEHTTEDFPFECVSVKVIASDLDIEQKQCDQTTNESQTCCNSEKYVEKSYCNSEENFKDVEEVNVSVKGDENESSSEFSDEDRWNDIEEVVEACPVPNFFQAQENLKAAEEMEIRQIAENDENHTETSAAEGRGSEGIVQKEGEQIEELPKKIDEAKVREKEREKERIAVERAIREARERAFAEARERAERAAVEKATAEARRRSMAEAREKVSTEANPKKSADKSSMEARLKAQRAAVERATAEARERALEKAMLEKAKNQAGSRFSVSSTSGKKQNVSSNVSICA